MATRPNTAAALLGGHQSAGQRWRDGKSSAQSGHLCQTDINTLSAALSPVDACLSPV